MPNNPVDVTYDEVKTRLDEIVEAVSDENISLDDALDLYEEAVKLGMNASQLIEDQTAAVLPSSDTDDDPDSVEG